VASSGKKKTTMAKLARESRLRERRLEKQAKKDAKKDARKLASAEGPGRPSDPMIATTDESARTRGQQPPLDPVVQQLADASDA
jgi:hypothetical protein